MTSLASLLTYIYIKMENCYKLQRRFVPGENISFVDFFLFFPYCTVKIGISNELRNCQSGVFVRFVIKACRESNSSLIKKMKNE